MQRHFSFQIPLSIYPLIISLLVQRHSQSNPSLNLLIPPTCLLGSFSFSLSLSLLQGWWIARRGNHWSRLGGSKCWADRDCNCSRGTHTNTHTRLYTHYSNTHTKQSLNHSTVSIHSGIHSARKTKQWHEQSESFVTFIPPFRSYAVLMLKTPHNEDKTKNVYHDDNQKCFN